MKIGIIGAMSIEIDPLIKEIKNITTEKISGITYYQGDINNTQVIVAVCGIGKVNAAICTQTLIVKYSPDYLINIGVAGGLSKELKIGDIIVATSVVQYDVDTSAFGDPIGLIPSIDVIHIKCSEKINHKLLETSTDLKLGVIATGDKFINDINDINFIVQNFKAIATEMEGGSIGQVCYINNIDFAIIRSISDNADGNSHVDFNENSETSAKKVIDLVINLLSSPL